MTETAFTTEYIKDLLLNQDWKDTTPWELVPTDNDNDPGVITIKITLNNNKLNADRKVNISTLFLKFTVMQLGETGQDTCLKIYSMISCIKSQKEILDQFTLTQHLDLIKDLNKISNGAFFIHETHEAIVTIDTIFLYEGFTKEFLQEYLVAYINNHLINNLCNIYYYFTKYLVENAPHSWYVNKIDLAVAAENAKERGKDPIDDLEKNVNIIASNSVSNKDKDVEKTCIIFNIANWQCTAEEYARYETLFGILIKDHPDVVFLFYDSTLSLPTDVENQVNNERYMRLLHIFYPHVRQTEECKDNNVYKNFIRVAHSTVEKMVADMQVGHNQIYVAESIQQ